MGDGIQDRIGEHAIAGDRRKAPEHRRSVR